MLWLLLWEKWAATGRFWTVRVIYSASWFLNITLAAVLRIDLGEQGMMVTHTGLIAAEVVRFWIYFEGRADRKSWWIRCVVWEQCQEWLQGFAIGLSEGLSCYQLNSFCGENSMGWRKDQMSFGSVEFERPIRYPLIAHRWYGKFYYSKRYAASLYRIIPSVV